MSKAQVCPIPSCLRAELPIDFHGLYDQYDAVTPHLAPQLAPEIDLAITADVNGDVMNSEIANYIEHGFVGSANLAFRQEIAHVFRRGGGFSEHWKLWQVSVTRETLKLVFAHRETHDAEVLQLTLATLGSARLTFRIISAFGACAIAHKLYLDYTKTSWQTAELKVAEWRQGVKDIAMMTWYLGIDCLRLMDLFDSDPQPLKHLLGPVAPPAES